MVHPGEGGGFHSKVIGMLVVFFIPLFTDGGGKLLLTQVASPRYSIQDDGVYSSSLSFVNASE